MDEPKPHPDNVPGDFYVEYDCCLTCEVPFQIAPELFSYAEPPAMHCYVSRQPATEDEFRRMVRVMAEADLMCIRYRGADKDRVAALLSSEEAELYFPRRKPRRPWWKLWRRVPDEEGE